MDGIGWPELLIIGGVLIVLFGSKKLPDAARSLGRSMRIMKTEIKGLHEDEKPAAPAELATAAPANAAPVTTEPVAEPVSAEQTTTTTS